MKEASITTGDDSSIAPPHCGCRAVAVGADPWTVKLCDLHAAAPDLLAALEPFARCQEVKRQPAEFVSREMALDAGEPTMEGTMLRGEILEPCLTCDGCRAVATIAKAGEAK